MISTLSLNRRCNLSPTNFSNQCEQAGRHTHTFVHTFIKAPLQRIHPFLCSEFSGVHCINPTCCRYILQSRHGHCKGTHFLIFLLKMLKDCDNLILLGTRSHIFDPRNETDYYYFFIYSWLVKITHAHTDTHTHTHTHTHRHRHTHRDTQK